MASIKRTDLENYGNPFIAGDDWDFGKVIFTDTDTFTDGSWKGCDYRCEDGRAYNITISGRKSFGLHMYSSQERYKTRLKIEAVGDGSESGFFSGWIYTNQQLCEV